MNAPNLDLAVLGNCAIAALVDQRARIQWCCIPRFDGDPIFCNLLRDPQLEPDGLFEIELIGFARARQRYIRNSAVLETTLPCTCRSCHSRCPGVGQFLGRYQCALRRWLFCLV